MLLEDIAEMLLTKHDELVKLFFSWRMSEKINSNTITPGGNTEYKTSGAFFIS